MVAVVETRLAPSRGGEYRSCFLYTLSQAYTEYRCKCTDSCASSREVYAAEIAHSRGIDKALQTAREWMNSPGRLSLGRRVNYPLRTTMILRSASCFLLRCPSHFDCRATFESYRSNLVANLQVSRAALQLLRKLCNRIAMISDEVVITGGKSCRCTMVYNCYETCVYMCVPRFCAGYID